MDNCTYVAKTKATTHDGAHLSLDVLLPFFPHTWTLELVMSIRQTCCRLFYKNANSSKDEVAPSCLRLWWYKKITQMFFACLICCLALGDAVVTSIAHHATVHVKRQRQWQLCVYHVKISSLVPPYITLLLL